jgi:hypothetical protein
MSLGGDMPATSSGDLRGRAAPAWAGGVSARSAANRFGVEQQPSMEIGLPTEIALVRAAQAAPSGDMITAPARSEVLRNEAGTSLPPEAANSAPEFNSWSAGRAFPANPSSPGRAALPRNATPTHRKSIVLRRHTSSRTVPEKHFSPQEATLTPPKR